MTTRWTAVTGEAPSLSVRSAFALARSCHPGPVVAVTLCATGYALAIGKPLKAALRVGLAIGTGQLAIGWQNDWIDADRDAAAGRPDKPVAIGVVTKSTVRLAATLAALGTISTSLANGRRSGLAHLTAVASASSYNVHLKRTMASFLPYAISFSLLPETIHQSGDEPEHAPAWAVIAAGALGVAAHFLNVLPDREADLEQGVRGLPQQLSRRTDIVLAACFLTLASLFITFGPPRRAKGSQTSFAASLVLGCLALVAASRRNDQSAFRLVLVVALFDVASLLRSARRSIALQEPVVGASNRRSTSVHRYRRVIE